MTLARTSSLAIAAAVAALILLTVSGGCGRPVFQGLRPLMAAEMRARRRRSASGVAAVPLRRRKEGERGGGSELVEVEVEVGAEAEVEVLEASLLSAAPDGSSLLFSSNASWCACCESVVADAGSEEEEEEEEEVDVSSAVASAAVASAAVADVVVAVGERRLAGKAPRLRLESDVVCTMLAGRRSTREELAVLLEKSPARRGRGGDKGRHATTAAAAAASQAKAVAVLISPLLFRPSSELSR